MQKSMRWLALVPGILMLSLAGGGCDSGGGEANQSGEDASVQWDASSTAPDAAVPQPDASTPSDSEDASTSGACTSEADRAIIDGATFSDDLSSCAMSCAFGSDPDCNVNCIADDTGLSPDCALCFADNVQCTMDHCLSQCASDSSSPGCLSCMETAGCTAAIATCSGIQL